MFWKKRKEVISAKGRHVSSCGMAAGGIWTLGASFAHPKRRRHYLIFDGRPDVSIQGTIWAIGQCHNKRPFFAVFRAAMVAKIMLFIISPIHTNFRKIKWLRLGSHPKIYVSVLDMAQRGRNLVEGISEGFLFCRW